MNDRSRALLAVAGLAAGVLGAGAPAVAEGAERARPLWLASFEGGTIDLRDGWGDATACRSDGVTTECFRTEAEMDASQRDGADAAGAAMLADCGGDLDLWSSSNKTGIHLALAARGTLINLSVWSFNNVTSSYQIGPCSASFYDSTGGSGLYPGSTSAFASANSMLAGWDNRVGSVLIS